MYTEVSTRGRGDKALLISPVIPGNQSHTCFTFFYHMYGEDIGSLTVQSRRLGSTKTSNLWTLSGNRGNSWKFASFPITVEVDYQVSKVLRHMSLLLFFYTFHDASKGGVCIQ